VSAHKQYISFGFIQNGNIKVMSATHLPHRLGTERGLVEDLLYMQKYFQNLAERLTRYVLSSVVGTVFILFSPVFLFLVILL